MKPFGPFRGLLSPVDHREAGVDIVISLYVSFGGHGDQCQAM